MPLLALLLWVIQPAPPAQQADRVVISKSQHTLTLLANGKALQTYKVALGRSSGAKQFEGDHKTPEGHYVVDGHRPNSRFYRALHLSYPAPADRDRAAAAHQNPGGDIEIHGLPPAISLVGYLQHTIDWTDGCIAVSNGEIEQIYAAVPNGTSVDIEP